VHVLHAIQDGERPRSAPLVEIRINLNSSRTLQMGLNQAQYNL
jgi:hypothetical protein